MATVTVYPNGDGTKGSGWADASSGTTNLYQSIDEGTGSPNDSDYVGCGTSNSTIFFLFDDMPVDFDTLTSYSLKLRLNHSSTKGDYHYFTSCQLFKADESTAIASAHSISSSSTITTFTFSTTPTYTDKTSWDGVRLKITVNNASGGGSGRAYAAQLDLTYTPTASGSTYDETGTGGGATAGGLALIAATYSIGATGGALAGGSAGVSHSGDAIEGTGGATLGGSAGVSLSITYETSGGVALGGEAGVYIDGEGGVVCSGSATVQLWLPCSGSQVVSTAGLYNLILSAWNGIEDDVFEVKILGDIVDGFSPDNDYVEDDFTYYETPIELDKGDFGITVNGNIVAIDAGTIPEVFAPETPDYIYGYALIGQTTRQVWWVNYWGLREINDTSPSYFNVNCFFKREE